MGGEWATGAALVARTWPAEHRGKALGLMQSARGLVGYAVAATVNAIVLPAFGWRVVFLFGVLPALCTLWIRQAVAESPMWLAGPRRAEPAALAAMLTGPARGSRGRSPR